MPTSSQSLILQTTSGQLPPILGHRKWRPEVPKGPESVVTEYPMITVEMRNNHEKIEKRNNMKIKPKPLKRAGTTQNLTYKVDYSTLPQLLQIRGIHGYVGYNTDSNSIHWKINSIGPFYERTNGGRSKSFKESVPGIFRYVHADRDTRSMYNREAELPEVETSAYYTGFRRRVLFHEIQSYQNDLQSLPEKDLQSTIYMAMKVFNGKSHLVKANKETADYFKLIHVPVHSDKEAKDTTDEHSTFRLEECRPSDDGCFRLTPTEPRDVGEFSLVPPPGYLSDDYRLVSSSEVRDEYVLLQSDPGCPALYRPVQRNKDTSGEFCMVQTKMQQSHRDRSKMEILMPREAWGDRYQSSYNGYENNGLSRPKDNSSIETTSVAEDRYNYFDVVRDNYRPSECESHRQCILHHQSPTYTASYRVNKNQIYYSNNRDKLHQTYHVDNRDANSRENQHQTYHVVNRRENSRENQHQTYHMDNRGANSRENMHQTYHMYNPGGNSRENMHQTYQVDNRGGNSRENQHQTYHSDNRGSNSRENMHQTYHVDNRGANKSEKKHQDSHANNRDANNHDNLHQTHYENNQDSSNSQTYHGNNRDITFENELQTFNQQYEEFNQSYMRNLRQESSGKHNSHVDETKMESEAMATTEAEERDSMAVKPGSNTNSVSSEWKAHNFDQWSRTTNVSNQGSLASVDLRVLGNIRNAPPINSEQTRLITEKELLLNEVQFKANYKLWKKRKVKTIRMRKDLPPEDANAVCIRFSDNTIAHDELKTKIETETGFQIVILQFDPVYIHSINSEAKSQWILGFNDASVCESLVENGIKINGEYCQVRRFDDVMKEEHEVYKLYQIMKDITERKAQKHSTSRKYVKRPKTQKTAQTQTGKQTV